MCGPYFDPKDLKTDWEKASAKISQYHIHIYFGSDNSDDWTGFEKAWGVAEKISALLENDASSPSHVQAGAGPHTKPNFEVDISREGFAKILPWLQMNSEGLSILVHPRTGDELRDHDAGLWLGTPVPFNGNFLDHFRDVKKAERPRKFG